MNRNNIGTEAGSADVSSTDPIASGEYRDPGSEMHTGMQGKQDRTLIGDTEARRYNDTVGFITEGVAEVKEMDDSKEDLDLENSIRPSAEQMHSIERILSRPTRIDTITFTTNNAAGNILGTYDIMQIFKNNAAFRLAREKLSSFYGVHWTAHLKVVLNPQPFECGIFQIFFLPFQSTSSAPVNPANDQGEYTLPFTTGCPNVFCNVAKQSEVELAVPYTGPVAFINLSNNTSDYGTYYVQSVSPLRDNTNAASCEMSVYMYFTSIDLFGTTPNSVVIPQSCPQPPRREANMKASGPISKLVSGVSSAVGVGSNALMPLLNLLGLSAPTADPNPIRMTINPYAMPATVDSTKVPQKVSYSSEQAVAIGELGVNTVIDEMDIHSIVEKPTYYNNFTWAVTNDADSLLMSYPVQPDGVDLQVPSDQGTTGKLVAPTRLRFVANSFRYWRGTIRYHFMISACKFHSGRLRFVYCLGGQAPVTNLPGMYPRTFSQIIDIRDATNFIIEVPYFASTAWRVVPPLWSNDGGYTGASTVGPLDDNISYLNVYVENELRAATATTDTINIVCMVSAGSDFEFATPIAPRIYPHIRANTAAANEVEPQGYDMDPVVMVSGRDSSETTRAEPIKLMIGEKISSVRSLIKRYQLLGAGAFANAMTTDVAVLPWYVAKPNSPATYSYNLLDYFRPLYKFYRGSMRYLITLNDQDFDFVLRYDPDILTSEAPATGNALAGLRPGVVAITAYNNGADFTSMPWTATVPYANNLQGSVEVEFPYYSRYHKHINTFYNATDGAQGARYITGLFLGEVPAGIGYLQLESKSTDTNQRLVRIYRAAGDDYSYGYLLGAPFVRVDSSRTN